MASPNTNVVFIDSNLDTHLALVVSDLDTVSDLKKRILSEHPLCFPKIGQIQIHGIKVKRKGYYYHLSDSMFVRSAFSGFNKSWFLSIDASALGVCGQNEQLFSHGSPNQLACLGIENNAVIGPGDNAISDPSKRVSSVDNFQLVQLVNKQDDNKEIPVTSPCVSEHTGKNLDTGVKSSGDNGARIPLPGSIPETEDGGFVDWKLPSVHLEWEVDESGKGVKDDRNMCEGDPSISVPSAKKKRKSKRKKEDMLRDDNSKDDTASVDNPLGFPSKRASSFQVPQLENKRDEKEEIPVVSSCVLECTGEVVKPLEMYVKGRSKRKKEDMLRDDNSKDDTASVDNPLGFPSKRASSFQVPKLNKRDEKEEIPVVSSCILEHTGEVVKPLEMDVKSSGNDDPGIPETRDYCCVSHELPGSCIECEVDGTNKGIKDNCIVYEEGNCKSVPNAKKKQKMKQKKEDTVQDDTSKENDAFVVEPVNSIVHQDIVAVTNPSENPDKEVIKETEVLKEHQHTACNNDSTKNDIDATVSVKEASEPGLATNKKHRKKKKSLILDSKELLKVETASQKDEAHMSSEAHKEIKESKDQIELNNDKSRDDAEYKHKKVTEGILDTRPSAKKKKGKEKSGEKSLFKAKLINDFIVDNASHRLLEDQQRIKNSSVDQSAEYFNDSDPLRTSVQGRRRKGKLNSSTPHETPVVTSSRKDEEAGSPSIQRGVQEEISEDGLFSKDISMSKTTIDNMEIGTDASKEGIPSTEKRTGNCKNHSDIEIKTHPSDVDEPMELSEDNENGFLDHYHKNEAGQTEGGEEGRKVSPQNEPKLIMLEKSPPSNQDATDANSRGLNATSKVVDVNEMTEPVKSEKGKRGMRKSKNSSGGPAHREGVGPVDASESETVIVKSLGVPNCNPKSGNTETEENPLNQTEGEKIWQEEMRGTILSCDKEDDFRADDAGSLEQIKAKSNAEHVDKRQRKKSNNKQTSASKSISNMPTKDQVLDSKKPSPSSDSGAHAKPSVEMTKKSKSTSTKSTNKSSKTNLEPAKDSVRLEPSDSRFNSGSNDAAPHSTCSPVEKGDNNLEAPSITLKVNDDQQFSSQKEQHEANLSDDVLLGKVNGMDRADIGTMTRKNMRGLEATIGQTHPERDVLRIHPDKKVPNVHRTGHDSKLSIRSGSATSSIGGKRKARVKTSGKNMDLEKQREHFPISKSKLEGSNKMLQNKAGKASGNNVGGVVSKTQQKKSLLAGAIFKDDSSGTSEDEVDNSDASTRTPSDNPLLSDSSDEDSSSGSYGVKSLENGGRSSFKASLSGTNGMSIDHILRSSSRFKKAKTTASQLEESESQPDFVPDSLADN
ncbi:hypothetical protein VNO77_44127 [Canavalia gladiata]|uniref:Uncharacterized protein n=1 Tax=Canavalia gladiata TaxID=3824 RepID=A0AAN9PQ29_CANGL